MEGSDEPVTGDWRLQRDENRTEGPKSCRRNLLRWTNITPLPLVFSHVRNLKGLQARSLQLHILKELQADNFGQNRAKRGVCPQVRIPKDLVVTGGRGRLARIMKNHNISAFICQYIFS